MKDFVAIITLPNYFTDEFMSLIPRQRAMTDRYMRQGKIISYFLSSDRTKLWITFKANTKSEVHKILTSMPLAKFMNIQIEQLFFHLNSVSDLYQVSLN